jgi:hypothetical protein
MYPYRVRKNIPGRSPILKNSFWNFTISHPGIDSPGSQEVLHEVLPPLRRQGITFEMPTIVPDSLKQMIKKKFSFLMSEMNTITGGKSRGPIYLPAPESKEQGREKDRTCSDCGI